MQYFFLCAGYTKNECVLGFRRLFANREIQRLVVTALVHSNRFYSITRLWAIVYDVGEVMVRSTENQNSLATDAHEMKIKVGNLIRRLYTTFLIICGITVRIG